MQVKEITKDSRSRNQTKKKKKSWTGYLGSASWEVSSPRTEMKPLRILGCSGTSIISQVVTFLLLSAYPRMSGKAFTPRSVCLSSGAVRKGKLGGPYSAIQPDLRDRSPREKYTMVVMGKKGDKANPWDRFIIACMSIISALPSSTLHCSHCSCYFHIEPLHFSLIYSPPCEIYFCIQQSEWPIAPSPHFLASLCPFCIIPAVLSFLFLHSDCQRKTQLCNERH